MSEIDHLADLVPRHEREGPTGELQAIDIRVHRVEDVLEIAPTHDGIIGPRSRSRPGIAAWAAAR